MSQPGIGVFLAECGQADVFSLNPLDTVPTITGPASQWHVDPATNTVLEQATFDAGTQPPTTYR